MLDLVPSARVGHVGLYRDPKSLVPVEYYLKLPDNLEERLCVVVDPMLATGNSAVAGVQRIKDAGANIFVAGSAIFNSDSYVDAIKKMKQEISAD